MANFQILEGMIWSTKHMTELRLLRTRILDSDKTSTVALGNHCNEEICGSEYRVPKPIPLVGKIARARK